MSVLTVEGNIASLFCIGLLKLLLEAQDDFEF